MFPIFTKASAKNCRPLQSKGLQLCRARCLFDITRSPALTLQPVKRLYAFCGVDAFSCAVSGGALGEAFFRG